MSWSGGLSCCELMSQIPVSWRYFPIKQRWDCIWSRWPHRNTIGQSESRRSDFISRVSYPTWARKLAGWSLKELLRNEDSKGVTRAFIRNIFEAQKHCIHALLDISSYVKMPGQDFRRVWVWAKTHSLLFSNFPLIYKG